MLQPWQMRRQLSPAQNRQGPQGLPCCWVATERRKGKGRALTYPSTPPPTYSPATRTPSLAQQCAWRVGAAPMPARVTVSPSPGGRSTLLLLLEGTLPQGGSQAPGSTGFSLARPPPARPRFSLVNGGEDADDAPA